MLAACLELRCRARELSPALVVPRVVDIHCRQPFDIRTPLAVPVTDNHT